jgi:hypothetical protein
MGAAWACAPGVRIEAAAAPAALLEASFRNSRRNKLMGVPQWDVDCNDSNQLIAQQFAIE